MVVVSVIVVRENLVVVVLRMVMDESLLFFCSKDRVYKKRV